MDKIRKTVKAAGVFVGLGYSERDRGSIYIAQICHKTLFVMQVGLPKLTSSASSVFH